MSENRFLLKILDEMLESVTRIIRWFKDISEPDDFSLNDEGIKTISAISMMLHTLGENLKKFETHGGKVFLDKHPEIDWKGAKGLRDVLGHQYFSTDEEIIFITCEEHIPTIKIALVQIRQELESSQ